ncbi:TlpA disulfide reductase family protein [Gallaecimonas sp. GXIMD4217]|uniref:TlpA family protein disulfide reductase n=1 Tax=Gallaecimonas sp. GXIMD4217 TaxID=3131927 RepID=UPI00311B4169
MLKRLIPLALLPMLAACAQTPPDKPDYLTYVSQGQQLPLPPLESIDGQSLDLALSSKRKLVILFATWCHDSQRTIRDLMASELARDDDLQIVGIGREESPDALARFAKEFGTNFPLVADPDRSLYGRFANAGIPRLILVDEHNQVVKTLIGEKPGVLSEVRWQ